MNQETIYSIIVPLYNEEEVLKESYSRISKVMKKITNNYEIVFINDGSQDKTSNIAESLCKKDKHLILIEFSRNFGHQIAITAGMEKAAGKAIIIIDADLQDPPEVIPEMINKWKEGYDVVYGKRKKRKGESLFKKLTATLFYRFINILSTVPIPTDVGDFRLIDRKVNKYIISLNEKNRYVRGLISWLGFKQTAVYYIREPRFAGKTKYPLAKMINFSLNAITSFSSKPLKIASYIGTLFAISGFIYLFYVFWEKFFTTRTVQGWTSVIAISLIANGITLLLLGIIGEYIGRIYEESKNRPLYVIDRIYSNNQTNKNIT